MPPATLLHAPPDWKRLACVSDLHLSAQTPRTTQAFLRWLRGPALQADAVFILGDLFEAWIGDDLLDAAAHAIVASDADHAQRVAAALHDYTAGGGKLWVQHGNRDFLLGAAFAQTTGAQILPDPAVLVFQGMRLLLTHGDLLCTADGAYLQFRAQVRRPEWQRQILARPLAERARQAQAMRAASQQAQLGADSWADADPAEARRWLIQHDCAWMIHGHTHRPRDHWGGAQLRQVLSDWDCDSPTASQQRAQALWLHACCNGVAVHRADCR
jgi:UDP-2,3-diacylglucosamine hydrolase